MMGRERKRERKRDFGASTDLLREETNAFIRIVSFISFP